MEITVLRNGALEDAVVHTDRVRGLTGAAASGHSTHTPLRAGGTQTPRQAMRLIEQQATELGTALLTEP